MRSLALAALLLALATALDPDAGWGADEEYADTHPPAGVVLTTPSGARHYEAIVRGRLLDWAALELADGSRQIYLLAAPEEDPAGHHSLHRVTLDPPGLVTLADALDGGLDRLKAIDGEAPELLIGGAGQLLRVTGLGGSELALEPIAAAPGLDLGADIPRRGDNDEEEAVLHLPSAGQLRIFSRSAGGDWLLAHRTPLPIEAERHAYGLRLTTPPTTLLRLPDGDALAVGPQAVGVHRLLSRIQPPTGGEPVEYWSRLPGPEHVQWSWFQTLDERPVLIVTTNSADKLGLFERQRLRLFTLYDDRTQAGVGPWLTAETTSRRWQPVEPFVADIDDDGDDDLVVAQIDGLGGGEMRLEAFVNSGERSFEASRRRTRIELPADDWQFGTDLTGDGLPDFVLFTEGRLEIYAGEPPGRRRLVERQPRWSFPGADIPRRDNSVTVSDGGVAVSDGRPVLTARPRPLDLDGDGRAELVMADNPAWGFGRLRILFLPDL